MGKRSYFIRVAQQSKQRPRPQHDNPTNHDKRRAHSRGGAPRHATSSIDTSSGLHGKYLFQTTFGTQHETRRHYSM